MPENIVSLLCYQNQLMDLPDLSGFTSLTKILVGRNQLTFQHLEPNIGKFPDEGYYWPQADVGPMQTLSVNTASNLTLSADYSGSSPNNRYQWFKNGTAIAGATSVSYVINNATDSHAGVYTCHITNTVVTGLTLRRRPITVVIVTPCISLTASPNVTVCAGTATTLTAAVTNACRSGLSFDGVDDYVDVPGLLNVTNSFTVEAWVWPTATHEVDAQSSTGYAGLYNQRYLIFPTYGDAWGAGQAGMGLSVGTNGVSVYEHGGNEIPPVLVWAGSLSGWTHLAVVYSNKQPSLYVNGTLVKTGSTSTKSLVRPSLGFGGGIYGYYQGHLDELRIWDGVRTPAQIQASQNTAVAANSPGLVGNWHLDEGSGSLATDATANGHPGTLSLGSTWNGIGWTGNYLIAPPTTTSASWQTPSVSNLPFQWSPATGLSATTGPSVTANPTQTTVYTVTDGIRSASVTVTAAACRIGAEETLAEQARESAGQVYPNPFTDQIQLRVRSEKKEMLSVTISDLRGRVLYAGTNHETNQEISLAKGLAHGVYILRASHGSQTEVFKIVKTE